MEKLWFKRKTYGYGWYPITKQGWLAILLFILADIAGAFILMEIFPDNEVKFSISFMTLTFILASILIFVSYKKGEKPRWQWGEKDKER